MKKTEKIFLLFAIIFCLVGCKNQAKSFNNISSDLYVCEQSSSYSESEIFKMQGYKINYRFKLLNNDSVGNDWSNLVYLNGERYENGDILELNGSNYATLKVVIQENDNLPDVSSKELNILLSQQESGITRIEVTENRGRYTGNVAVWEFEYTVTAV